MMQAMVLHHQKEKLQLEKIPIPKPRADEILIKVMACGICRTDLHVVDGDLTEPKLPLVPGHQIVGVVAEVGSNVTLFKKDQRVGVPWLGSSCGHCEFCLSDRENLCDQPRFTGYNIDGGFAEFCVANARFCFPIPGNYSDSEAAPLLCAGLIGYRSLRKAGAGIHLGLYGFGAAAHLVLQVALYQGRKVYAFTRPNDVMAQTLANKLGATWVGDSLQQPPEVLDAAIIFAPDGSLVPIALKNLKKGGVVVCAGIHMSDIPSFPYHILWGERSICSVANLTHKDGEEFLSIAPLIPIKTETHVYPLNKTNEALDDLRQGRFSGAAVIVVR